MIRLQNSTPDIYYKQSRDFQFIGRLYDVVLNSVKTNADIIANSLPFNENNEQNILKLFATTLGFKPKHQYSRAQLVAICSIFSEILKNKGNIKAVQIIGETILKTEGIVGDVHCLMLYDPELNKYFPTLRIIVPDKLAEIALFYDLLEYVIPAGCTVEIIRGEILPNIEAQTLLSATDEVKVLRDLDGNKIPRNFALQTPAINQAIVTVAGESRQPSKKHIASSFVWRRGNIRKDIEYDE